MKDATTRKHILIERRARRVRSRMEGTVARPRLTVARSLKHIYVQMIDDTTGRTLVAASDRDVKTSVKPVERAKEVGRILALRSKEKGIETAIFDRGSYRYHGRVAALAEGAREAGLII